MGPACVSQNKAQYSGNIYAILSPRPVAFVRPNYHPAIQVTETQPHSILLYYTIVYSNIIEICYLGISLFIAVIIVEDYLLVFVRLYIRVPGYLRTRFMHIYIIIPIEMS